MTHKWKFFWATIRHKWYVFIAGLRIGGIPLRNLIFHDWVKFTPTEFGPYSRKFYATYPDTHEGRLQMSFVNRRFGKAWLHHENSQRHHWGYWIPRSGWYANKPLMMPEDCVREMVADFMGASREYTGSWDMSIWLDGNYDSIESKLSFTSATIFFSVLSDLGYEKPRGASWHRCKPPLSKYPSLLARLLARWLDASC